MSHNGVRKRLKVRWMHEADGGTDTHAFLLLRPAGRVRDYAMCGLRLGAMHRWTTTPSPGRGHQQCVPCKQAMSKGGRA